EIAAMIAHHTRELSDSDRDAIGYRSFVAAATRGFAAHHAGMLPLLKECVEQLFVAGLLRVVFATETLALGINMPAKAVVLESLIKWDGTGHVMLSAGQYTQLIGRAGRRGIDVEGHAVVVHDERIDVDTIVGLASTRTYPLNSAFRPTYSMAVNLLSWLDKHQAVGILESSFAQFQTDRQVAHIAARVRRQQEALEGYAEALQCQCGDYQEYLRIQEELTQAEKRARSRRRNNEMQQALRQLQRGSVIDYRFGRRTYRGVVQGVSHGRNGIVVSVIDMRGRLHMMITEDFREPPRLAGHISIKRGADRSKAGRTALAHKARRFGPGKKITIRSHNRHIDQLRTQLQTHPSHSCPNRADHEKWGRRYRRLYRDLSRDKRTLEANTDTLGKEFTRICTHLHRLGYLSDDDQLTSRGELLRTITNEVDLVITEVIARKAFHNLRPATLAAAVSALVYQPRGEDAGLHPRFSGRLQKAMLELATIAGQIALGEADLGITPMRDLDGGLVETMRSWATGAKLEAVLASGDLLPGDFVRNAKQCVDVIDQMRTAATSMGDQEFATRLGSARALIFRGIVAWSAV
ncbi:MAG: helicase-related protein, partial [Bowdeniella nasicola]|nr:helicase-related protein [Bowdeniella nasicola]